MFCIADAFLDILQRVARRLVFRRRLLPVLVLIARRALEGGETRIFLSRSGACQRGQDSDRREAGDRNSRHTLQYGRGGRSEEHTSELQSLMRISYAVFCLKQ